MVREPNLQDRFIGTILGVGVGDALGAPVEGWSRSTIKTVLGVVRGYQLTLMGKGIYTDETQLTLLLVKSILNQHGFDPSMFGKSIGEWMKLSDDGVESARGVGRTISLAARKLYRGVPWNQSGEFSASNGAAVRVAPLVLMHYKGDDVTELLHDVENASKPTHIDPLAIEGAQLFAIAIWLILKEDRFFFDKMVFLEKLIELSDKYTPKITTSITQLKKHISRREADRKVLDPMQSKTAFTCTRECKPLDDPYNILDEIGTGKYVVESVPAALFCFLNSPDNFEQSLLLAVNAGGDTDSIGSMTGALSGALNGAQALPMGWLMDLENREIIMDLAIRLHDLALGLEVPEGIYYVSPLKIRAQS